MTRYIYIRDVEPIFCKCVTMCTIKIQVKVGGIVSDIVMIPKLNHI
jgi:hypothetical protein